MRARVHDERPPVKFRLPRGHDAIPSMQRQGYAQHPAVRHEDTWFERPQGAMLGSIVLRQVLPDGGWTMAWETTINAGPEAERHHLWTAVDGPRMWKRLERLGMEPVLTLQAQRVPLHKGPSKVAVERIQKVGDFLEVPGPDKSGVFRGDVSQLLRALGAEGPLMRSYRDLAAPAASLA
jgi:adenylate cyclase class IV